MKKVIMSMATCALVLSGCSLNEVLDSPSTGQNDGEIHFGVNTPVTRAQNLWSNDNFATQAGKFKVVGATMGATAVEYLGTFTNPVTVNYDAALKEWSYSNKLYWPTGTLAFYSWYDGTDALKPSDKDMTKGEMSFSEYKVNADLSKQLDFVVGAGEYKKEDVSTIYLKHALTKILFKAEVVKGSQLSVTIDDVMLCNVNDKGNLKVTAASGTDKASQQKLEWSAQGVQGSAKAKYTMGTFDTPISLIALAATSGNSQSRFSLYKSSTNGELVSSMLLVPQDFDAWDPSDANQKIADGTTGELVADLSGAGAFIGVKCSIEALKADNTSFDNKVYLHGGATTKWLYIPISSIEDLYGEWVANRAITYVITFGDTGSGSGGGGWTGDDGNNDGKIDPVLVPINFTVDVTDWDKCDVILQSVNFNRPVTEANVAKEVKDVMSQLLTETANNPQKRYDAKITLSFDNLANNIDLSTNTDLTAIFAKFANNNKLLANSKITLDVKATAWAGGKTLKFPSIDGWKCDATTLSAAGTVVYTKTDIAQVEANRLNAATTGTVMTISGDARAVATWDYSTVAFAKLATTGNYLVLNLEDLSANNITIKVGSGFKVMAISDVKDAGSADFSSANQTAEASSANKVIVIKKN